MRTTLLKLLEDISRSVPVQDPVYEFGSYRVPGQQHLPKVRDFFPGLQVVGCDLRPGPGVDRLEDLHRLTLPDESVGTALMFDTIEHVAEPWRALSEIHRCLKPGGLLLMSSVWFFPIHAYPDDYWRFTSSGFRVLLHQYEIVAVDMCGLARMPHTVIAIASKGPADPVAKEELRRIVSAWKESGARTWKEAVLDACPPVLLYPLYHAYLRTMGFLYRERED